MISVLRFKASETRWLSFLATRILHSRLCGSTENNLVTLKHFHVKRFNDALLLYADYEPQQYFE